MNELLKFGNEKFPSEIKNPFNKKGIKRIRVTFQDFWDDGRWKADGVVEFKNGKTEGKQEFSGDTFDDVVKQIKVMLDNLK